ncbi:hypothetical protein HanRHA438_Chr01g0010321 [Helianthus annuus]|uniref:Uncharacterized protein n=1 Tax=Helianthus annuus TaxID=4232 RepID=A0A251VLB7_HELAN|nr:hypothetical protein HanXRQr2_Chr01g0009921 [Helianthus annuus]KAJ0610824.1 hypothetical protein HanHA300_Chr01g0008191 [Helianthus annuus]KAJ0621649.1 hypothetical protein HanIR_Chr01g0011101 [Helianthus annuus]KAJ0947004.1 hypothetical protein HanRHA438_Chr01g0010321 [Helianthus annuus]
MVFLNTVLYTHSNKKKKKLKPKNFLSSPKDLTSPLHHLLAACSTLHGSSPNRRTLNPNQTSRSLNTFEEILLCCRDPVEGARAAMGVIVLDLYPGLRISPLYLGRFVLKVRLSRRRLKGRFCCA